MTSVRGLTRRAVLVGLGGVMGGLAGCGQAPAATPTPSSPIVETAFEGPELVVHLRDGHDVSQLNLIDPDGELFATTDVAAGATTARLEILRIEPGSRMKHYTPGVHTLVAVGEDEERSVDLEMEPSLRVVEVEQYRAGTEASDLGRLAVTIENVGTGPTWVYQITYRDSPYWTANDELAGEPGLSRLQVPNDVIEIIIGPGESKKYVGSTMPLAFIDQSPAQCDGTIEFDVVVGTPLNQHLEQTILVTVNGEVHPVGQPGDFVCSQFEVDSRTGAPSESVRKADSI